MNDLLVLGYCKNIKTSKAVEDDLSASLAERPSFVFNFLTKKDFNEARSVLQNFPFFTEVFSTAELAAPLDKIIDVVDDLLCLKNIFSRDSSASCRSSLTHRENTMEMREILLGKLKNPDMSKKLYCSSDSSIRNIFFSSTSDVFRDGICPEFYSLMAPVSFLEFEENLKSISKEIGKISTSFVDKITPIVDSVIKSEKFPLFYVKDGNPSKHLNILLTIAEDALTDIINFCGVMFLTFAQNLFMGTQGMFRRSLFSLQLVRSRDVFSLDFDPERIRKRLTYFFQSEYLKYIRPTKCIREFLGRKQNWDKFSFAQPTDNLIDRICSEVSKLCNEVKDEGRMLIKYFQELSLNPSVDLYEVKYNFGSVTKTICEGKVSLLIDKAYQWIERQLLKKLSQKRENQRFVEIESCSRQRWKKLLNKEENMVSQLHRLVKRKSSEVPTIVTGGSSTVEDALTDLTSESSAISKNAEESFTKQETGENKIIMNVSLPPTKVERLSSASKKTNAGISATSKEEKEKKIISRNTLPHNTIRPSHTLQYGGEKRKEIGKDSESKLKSDDVSLPYITSGDSSSNFPSFHQDSPRAPISQSQPIEKEVINRNVVIMNPAQLSLSHTDAPNSDSLPAQDTASEAEKHILPSGGKGFGKARFSKSTSPTQTGVYRPSPPVNEGHRFVTTARHASGKKEFQVDNVSQASFSTSIGASPDDWYNLSTSLSCQTPSPAEMSYSVSVNPRCPCTSSPNAGYQNVEGCNEGTSECNPLSPVETRVTTCTPSSRKPVQMNRLSQMPGKVTTNERGRVGRPGADKRGNPSPWWKKSQTESIRQQQERKSQLFRLQKTAAQEFYNTSAHTSVEGNSYSLYLRSQQTPVYTAPSVEKQEEMNTSGINRPLAFVTASPSSPSLHKSSPDQRNHSSNLPQIFSSKLSYDHLDPFHYPSTDKRESQGAPPQSYCIINNNEAECFPHFSSFGASENSPSFSSSFPYSNPSPHQGTAAHCPAPIRSSYPTSSLAPYSRNEGNYSLRKQLSRGQANTALSKSAPSEKVSTRRRERKPERSEALKRADEVPFEDDFTGMTDMVELYMKECYKNGVKPTGALLRVLETMRYDLCLSALDFSSLNYDIRNVRPVLALLAHNQDYLQVLDFSNCYLENKHIVELFYFLRKGNTGANLEQLNLSGNPITYVGGMSILKIVMQCPLLRYVQLSGTSIPETLLKEIYSVIDNRFQMDASGQ